MELLHVPINYESLPEFWQLCEALRAHCPPSTPKHAITESATVVWMRLWRDLGFLAQSTNRPGWLNAAGIRRFQESCEPRFGDNVRAVDVCSEGATPLLVKISEEEFECPLFKKLCGHLAGNHMPAHERGNLRSRFSASLKNIGQTAMFQATLFEPGTFSDKAGKEIDRREVDKCMNLILRLDRALLKPNQPQKQRMKGDYTAGLLADAVEVVRKQIPDQAVEANVMTMRDFFYFIMENRDIVPETTEEVLRDFEKLFETAKLKKGSQ